jgi:hypothetical protein
MIHVLTLSVVLLIRILILFNDFYTITNEINLDQWRFTGIDCRAFGLIFRNLGSTFHNLDA